MPPQRLCKDNPRGHWEHFHARKGELAQGFGESSPLRLLMKVLSSPDLPPADPAREYLRNFAFTFNSRKASRWFTVHIFEFAAANTVFTRLFS
jgi:hypothetical protein